MRRKQAGLTLVELMVTLAAAIILVAVGLPFFGGVVANNRAAAQVNDLVMALKVARSEAIGRANEVSVRPEGSDDDWTDGWIVFVDSNADGALDAGEDILRRWEALGDDATVALADDNDVGLARVGVTFDLNGALVGVAAPPVGFDMDQSDATGLVRRCVLVSTVGQVRTVREGQVDPWSCP